jgi:hypothetical protein
MTTAVCLRCGHFKFGAWTECNHCGHFPSDTLERLQNILVSDKVAKPESLERISKGLQRGGNLEFDSRDIRPGAEGDAATFARLIQSVESGQPPPPELQKTLAMVTNFKIPASELPPLPQPKPTPAKPTPVELPAYYLAVSGERQGPYTWAEVLSRLNHLPPDATIWHPNTNEWRPVRGMPLI